MSRFSFLLPCVALLSACTSFNEKNELAKLNDGVTKDPAYQPYNFWNPDGLGGYKDANISNNKWEIDAFIWGTVEGHAVNLAMYRMMLFARYNNFSKVSVIDARYVLIYPERTQDFTIVAVGINDNTTVPLCEAKGRFVSYCRIYDVGDALSTLQGILHMTDNDTKSEIEKISLKYPK